MSGIEAVKKIVETEAQAKRTIEDAKTRAQELIDNATELAQKARKDAITEAERKKAQMLEATREKAEADAKNSDVETDTLLAKYQKLFQDRKEVAVKKAVEVILGG